ncbi:MAG: hypothetical protein ACE5KA_02760 [Nitrososphaerales archaeon]
MVNSANKNNIISLRINHDIVQALKDHARLDRMSLNILANNVLQNYVEWERDAKKAGFIPVTKDMLSSILHKVSDEDIVEIVEQTKDIIKAQIIYMEKRYDLQAFLHWLRHRCTASGFSEKEFYQNDNLICIVQHELGWKWSIYFKTMIKMVLDDLVRGKVDFDISSSMLILRIAVDQQTEQSALEIV